jgi:hydrogenase maturation protease
MTPRVPIFVCGEPARGDDAAGFAAIDLLPADLRDRVEVVPVGQLDILFLMDLPADAPCVVVDAVAGLRPGEVWVRPLAALVGRSRALQAAGRAPELRSSHELPLEQVLDLAATLRDAPPAGTFVGIGGACFDIGTPLTASVAAALPALVAAITAEVAAINATESGGLIDSRWLVLTSPPIPRFADNAVLGGLQSIGRPDRHQAG